MIKSQRNTNLPIFLIAPTMFILTVTILVPEIWALVISLFKYTYGEPLVFQGTKNYVRIFLDNAFWNAFRNNVAFVALAILLEFMLGLLVALLLHRGFPLQRLWIALIISPYALSEVIGVIIWRYMLNPDYGITNYLFSLLGMGDLNWFTSPFLSFIAVVILDVWRFAPFVAMILYAALSTIPSVLFEAAEVDGASYTQILRNIMLPMIYPAMLTAFVFRIIFLFRTFGIIWLLTRGGPVGATEVLSIYLYRQGFRYWHFGIAAAVAFVMLIITFIVSIHIMRIMHRRMFAGRL